MGRGDETRWRLRSDRHLARALEGRAEGQLGDEAVGHVDAHALLVHPARVGLRVELVKRGDTSGGSASASIAHTPHTTRHTLRREKRGGEGSLGTGACPTSTLGLLLLERFFLNVVSCCS